MLEKQKLKSFSPGWTSLSFVFLSIFTEIILALLMAKNSFFGGFERLDLAGGLVIETLSIFGIIYAIRGIKSKQKIAYFGLIFNVIFLVQSTILTLTSF